jgi:hypothetical protein
MEYRINGREPPCPTTFRWLPRRVVDVQGDNRPIYAAPRQCEFRFDLVGYEDFSALQDFFFTIQSTGTAVINVPAYPYGTGIAYGYREYSGCTMAEPTMGPFFEEHPVDAVLLITNVVTE